MNIQIRTNTTPINPGDDVTIAFLPDTDDRLFTNHYSVHLSFDSGATFTHTIADNVSRFAGEYSWNAIDVIGATLRVRVTSHRIPTNVSAFSPVFSVVPLSPRITDPIDEQTSRTIPPPRQQEPHQQPDRDHDGQDDDPLVTDGLHHAGCSGQPACQALRSRETQRTRCAEAPACGASVPQVRRRRDSDGVTASEEPRAYPWHCGCYWPPREAPS